MQEVFWDIAVKDNKSISIMLKDNELFSLNQYKIINNQTQNIFLKCQKVQRNGKIGFIYNLQSCERVIEYVKHLGEKEFYVLCCQITEAVFDVAKNGFLMKENLLINQDMVYFDKENLRIKLCYLPVMVETDVNISLNADFINLLFQLSGGTYREFEDVLREGKIEKVKGWLSEKIANLESISTEPLEAEEPLTTEEKAVEDEIVLESPDISVNDKAGKERKWLWIVLGVFMGMVFMIVVLLSSLGRNKNKIDKSQVDVPTNAVTKAIESTNTPTPKPTFTPKPTATPQPTVTPTPLPTETPTPTAVKKSYQEEKQAETQEETMVPQNQAPQSNPQVPVQQNNNVPPQEESNEYEGLDDFIIVE